MMNRLLSDLETYMWARIIYDYINLITPTIFIVIMLICIYKLAKYLLKEGI